MASSLLRALLEAHSAPGAARGRPPGTGAVVELALDHVVMDAAVAPLVLQYFESTGSDRVAVELALACAESPPPGTPFEEADELAYVQSASRRYGIHFSRPGHGLSHHVYTARFAAPGRTLLAGAGGLAAAGALGTLALAAGPAELALALTGAPHATRPPSLWSVQLEGRLPPGVGAWDLVLALAGRIPATGPQVILEYAGGLAALAQEARFTLAREAARLGVAASLFPSDEVTRDWLRAQGREPDWKPLAGNPDADAERAIEISLDTLEPMVARASRLVDPVGVREVSGMPVSRFVLGPDAGLDDLVLVAEVVRERALAPGVDLIVVPGSRAIRAAAAACGALAALAEAGARVVDAEVRLPAAPRGGAVLLCGVSARAARGARVCYWVGPGVGVASALVGRLADPRELPARAPFLNPPGRYALGGPPPLRPAADPASVEIARGPRLRALPVARPIVTTLRGVVLVRLPDRMGTGQALVRAPRVWRHRTDFAALGESLYAQVDPSFARRARALGGGFVVAGADYGVGPPAPRVALALVQLGIRVLIAGSYDPGHRDELIHHGILPLRHAGVSDLADLETGHELEIPGLPDAIERNKPLVVRNLTRGTQLTLHHDLDPRGIEMVRAGGLLAAGARSGARS